MSLNLCPPRASDAGPASDECIDWDALLDEARSEYSAAMRNPGKEIERIKEGIRLGELALQAFLDQQQAVIEGRI